MKILFNIIVFVLSLSNLILAQDVAKKELGKEEKKSVEFRFYGTVQMDAGINNGSFVGNGLRMWASDESKDHIIYTIKSTKLGTKILFPKIEKVKLLGVIDFDFWGNTYNSGFAESGPMPRLRNAYIDISKTYNNSTVGFLVGNAFDVGTIINFPTVIGTVGGWGIGNVWQILPQAQIYFNQKLGDLNTGIKVAATRPVSGNSLNRSVSIETKVDAGDASKSPLIQGSIYLKGKTGPISINLGVGGTYGKENYEFGASDVKDTNDMPVDGSVIDVRLINAATKISHRYANISGKYYQGKNIDIFGSFSSGPTSDYNESQKAKGYFVQIGITPISGVAINGGYGVDDPDEDQINANVKYIKNTAIWGNIYYTIFKRYTIGVQYFEIKTEKNNSEEIKASSILGTFKLAF